MILFTSDYTEGCHEKILAALSKTNMEQTIGYGQDEYCEKAKEKIKDAFSLNHSDIHFSSEERKQTLRSYLLC